MTLRNLLFKSVNHNLKRRIWCFSLLFLVFFATLPFQATVHASHLNSIASAFNYKDKLRMLYEDTIFSPNQNMVLTVFVILSAILCGFCEFCYLNSKKKVDLYHAMPMKRETILVVRFLSGGILFFLPFLLNVVLTVGVSALQGGMSVKALRNACSLMGYETLFFVIVYELVILAMLLTGNYLMNGLMIALFLVGSLVCRMVFGIMKEYFFSSYYYSDFWLGNGISIFPGEGIIKVLGKYQYSFGSASGNTQEVFSIGAGNYVWMLFLLAVMFGIMLLLYRKRPSESCQKAIVFEKTELVIKMIVVPIATFASAIILDAIVRTDGYQWLLTGGLAAFVFTSILLEIIFRADFAEGLHHLWHMGVNLILVIIVFCVFRFDLFEYDSYQPPKDQVMSMAVRFMDLDSELMYCPDVLQKMEIREFDKAYELSSYAIAQQKEEIPFIERRKKEETFKKTWKDAVAEIEAIGEEKNATDRTIVVQYNLKNGRKVTRMYTVAMDEKTIPLISAIYDNPSYKKAVYPILTADIAYEKIHEMEVDCVGGYFNNTVSKESFREIVNAYREEFSALSFSSVMEEAPIGTFTYYTTEKNEEVDDSYNVNSDGAYCIYPQFTKTIEAMKKAGFVFNIDFEKTKIVACRVSYWRPYLEDERGEETTVSYDQQIPGNQAKIEEIIKNSTGYYGNQNAVYGEEALNVYIEYINTETGNYNSYYGCFKNGKTPEFVKKDMIKAIKEKR